CPPLENPPSVLLYKNVSDIALDICAICNSRYVRLVVSEFSLTPNPNLRNHRVNEKIPTSLVDIDRPTIFELITEKSDIINPT
ncbi:2614_t:CDS:2, partial [Dentiscutata heterogama]